MRQLNHVFIEGRLTREPELKYLPSGMALCSFSIAFNKRFKKGEEWQEKKNFFDCKAWGKDAEKVSESYRKGALVTVSGELEMEEWERDGKKNQKVVIVAASVRGVIDGARPSDGLDFTQTQEKPAAASSGGFSAVSEVADDVPF